MQNLKFKNLKMKRKLSWITGSIPDRADIRFFRFSLEI